MPTWHRPIISDLTRAVFLFSSLADLVVGSFTMVVISFIGSNVLLVVIFFSGRFRFLLS